MSRRVAVVGGVRTPFCRAGTDLKEISPENLGAVVVRELLARVPIYPSMIDEVIFGNVIQPPHATNIARVLAVKGGIPISVPAMTVNRNCASGLEAVVNGADKIRSGRCEITLVGGVESMSQFPILFKKEMREIFYLLSKARNLGEKLKVFSKFRFRFLLPDIPKIADPICGLVMGETAENLAREFHITREQQDAYALESHRRAALALKSGRFSKEIIPVCIPPNMDTFAQSDNGIRVQQTLEDLKKLKPCFEKYTGTVTAGTSSQVTDGACALLLMSEQRAKELNIEPLGYLGASAEAGVEPSRMGFGPVNATLKLLNQTQDSLDTFDLIEINEAFAVQVLSVVEGFKRAGMGEIDRERLNVNGGAIALGHPVGVSGARLVLTTLIELKERNKSRALVTLCVGGGQGESQILEAE